MVTRQRKVTLDILEETARFLARLCAGAGHAALYQTAWIRWSDSQKSELIRAKIRFAGGAYWQGFSEDDMIFIGVLGKSDRDGRLYEHFRDRVIFPIENRQGKVVAFVHARLVMSSKIFEFS